MEKGNLQSYLDEFDTLKNSDKKLEEQKLENTNTKMSSNEAKQEESRNRKRGYLCTI